MTINKDEAIKTLREAMNSILTVYSVYGSGVPIPVQKLATDTLASTSQTVTDYGTIPAIAPEPSDGEIYQMVSERHSTPEMRASNKEHLDAIASELRSATAPEASELPPLQRYDAKAVQNNGYDWGAEMFPSDSGEYVKFEAAAAIAMHRAAAAEVKGQNVYQWYAAYCEVSAKLKAADGCIERYKKLAAAEPVPTDWKKLAADDKPDASRLLDVILSNGVCLMGGEYAKIDWTQVRDWRYTKPAASEAVGVHIKWLHETLREAGYCIDGGKCHHAANGKASCGPLGCFRQEGCVPLTGSGLRDDWTLAAPAAPTDANELHFNATRLRNVAKLVGMGSAIPQTNELLDGARGSVLGQIAAKLRAGAPTDAGVRDKALEEAAKLMDDAPGGMWANTCGATIRALKSSPQAPKQEGRGDQ